MAVTRRIGNLTIHFLGDNAEQLAGMFDDAHYRWNTFRRDMDETSRTHRNIYVGSALADLQDQPEFGNAGFDPDSKEVKESPAFGKAAGAETHFIVVKPGSHSQAELPNNLVPAVRLDAGEDTNTTGNKPLRYLSSRIAGCAIRIWCWYRGSTARAVRRELRSSPGHDRRSRGRLDCALCRRVDGRLVPASDAAAGRVTAWTYERQADVLSFGPTANLGFS